MSRLGGLGRNPNVENPYPSWEEAAEAVRKIPEIIDSVTYSHRYWEDKRLPSSPLMTYGSIIWNEKGGWRGFLGENYRSKYDKRYEKRPQDRQRAYEGATWAAKKAGITTQEQYEFIANNPKLFSKDPEAEFGPHWPGWDAFLGK